MATVNYSVPDEIKERFNQVFAHENKSHLIAELMKQAITEKERQARRVQVVDALLKLQAQQKPLPTKAIKIARQKGRP